MRFALYDRRAAVLYAHRWAYGRNPAFYDYEHLKKLSILLLLQHSFLMRKRASGQTK